jgi:hypothetical protein
MTGIARWIVGAALGLLIELHAYAQPLQYHVDSRHSNHAAYANGPGHSGAVPTLNATYTITRPASVSVSATAYGGSQPVIANDAAGPRYLFRTVFWADSSGGKWSEFARTDLSTGVTAELMTVAATDSLPPAITTDGARVLFAYNPPGVYNPVLNYTFVNGSIRVFDVVSGALVGPNVTLDAPVSKCTTAKIGNQHWAYFLSQTTYSYGPPPVEVYGNMIWACNIGAGGAWFNTPRFYTYPAAPNQVAGLTGDILISEPTPLQPTQYLNCLVARWQNIPQPQNNAPTLDILSLNPTTLAGGVAYITNITVASNPGLLALGRPYDGSPNTPYTLYLNSNWALSAYRGGANLWTQGVGLNSQGGPAVQSGTSLSSEIVFDIGNYFNGSSFYGALYAFYGTGTARYSPPAPLLAMGGGTFGMGHYDILVDQGGYQYVPFVGTGGVALLNPSGSKLWYFSGPYGMQIPATLPGFSPAIDTSGRLYLVQSNGSVRRYVGP